MDISISFPTDRVVTQWGDRNSSRTLYFHGKCDGRSSSVSMGSVSRRSRRSLVVSSSSGPGKPANSGRIIIPTSTEVSSADLYLPFRPPAQTTPASTMSDDEKFEILKERRGLWHQYADVLSSLLKSGISPSTIDEVTSMTGHEQNNIVVGAQVFNSIKDAGISEECLSYFDVGGSDILYELRTLSAERRRVAAEYVFQEKLDAKGAWEVAKAMREYERRKREEGREFFSNHPGDCLAFNLYRQSKEYRSQSEKISVLTKGLSRAVTEKGRKKIESELFTKEAEADTPQAETAKSTTRIEAIRLMQDETAFRPVPVLASLEELTETSFGTEDSGTVLEGPFQIFSPAASTRWIALPFWAILKAAKSPAAISVPDITLLPSFSSILSSECMLVVDRGLLQEPTKPDAFYLVAKEGQGVGVTVETGLHVFKNGKQPLAKVLVAILPALPPEPEGPEDWE